MARFWIGTSGWHYKHWEGRLYPKGLAAREWLAYYAARFPTVEINASFYRQPSDSTWDLWRSTAPEGFLFAVKASRFITHIRRLANCAEPLERFLRGARRLGDRLGPILYQMPPSFHRTQANVGRLEEFASLLPREHRRVLEFRHSSWFGEDTISLLRRKDIGFCSFDMAGLDCPLAATAPFAYMRFHGSEAVYASNYTDEMLKDWSVRLRELARKVEEVYVYFNNDAEGFAVFNARRLAELLGVHVRQQGDGGSSA